MNLVRVRHEGGAYYGALRDDGIDLLESDPFSGVISTGVSVNPNGVEVLAPTVPSKVVAVGLNYRDHAKELGMEIPAEPILFLKPPSSVVGPGVGIIYPDMAGQVDYEGELAVVIGKRAAGIRPDEAADHIFGYTCANDITARDLQRRDGQWTRAKSFDTFCPLGPHIETELDPAALSLEVKQNDLMKQASNTDKMIFDVFELTSFISRVMTLCPGDVILTGTPPGVGAVAIGDVLSVEIGGIGRLENPVT